MQAGISQHGITLGKLMHRGGVQFVGMGHGASGIVGYGKVPSRKLRLSCLVPRTRDSVSDARFRLCHGIGGEGMAEILHDIEAFAAANHAQTDYVIVRVKQVGAVRRR